MLYRADLHCHSNCSDGSDDPSALLYKAKTAMLQGISITDHDTASAYTPELFALAQSLSLDLISGIEISSEYEQVPVHILGYGYDLSSPSFALFLQDMKMRRCERNRNILKRLADRGMPLDETAFGSHSVGRPHIAKLLVQKGYVASIPEAFERYLKDGACCWVSGFRVTPTEVIGQIQKAGGKAVLAHPHFYKKGAIRQLQRAHGKSIHHPAAYREDSFLSKLLASPFDGIECYYSILHSSLELPWVKLAKERGWIATGGSDYHGTIKPHIPLGASWVGEAVVHALRGF